MQVILYAFPAICWLYGAGVVFSSFVSVVFWGAPLQQLLEWLRRHSTVIRPLGMQARPTAAACSSPLSSHPAWPGRHHRSFGMPRRRRPRQGSVGPDLAAAAARAQDASRVNRLSAIAPCALRGWR